MNKEKLNVVLEFNKTNKFIESPILLNNILWGYLTDNILYGYFHHPDFKYIHTQIQNEYKYKKNWLIVICEPIIYQKINENEFISLRDLCLNDYYNHEDYWKVNILFEKPECCYIYAKELNCLKYEQELFAIYFGENFEKGTSEFSDKLNQIKKSKNIGYIYNKETNEIELNHEEYSEIVGNILNDLYN